MVRTLSFQLSNTSSILVQGTKSGCSVMVTRVKKKHVFCGEYIQQVTKNFMHWSTYYRFESCRPDKTQE